MSTILTPFLIAESSSFFPLIAAGRPLMAFVSASPHFSSCRARTTHALTYESCCCRPLHKIKQDPMRVERACRSTDQVGASIAYQFRAPAVLTVTAPEQDIVEFRYAIS